MTISDYVIVMFWLAVVIYALWTMSGGPGDDDAEW